MGKRKERAKQLFRDKELSETKHYSKKVSAIVLGAFSVLSCILAAIGVVILKTKFPDNDAFKAFVDENYILSVFLLILICAVQASQSVPRTTRNDTQCRFSMHQRTGYFIDGTITTNGHHDVHLVLYGSSGYLTGMSGIFRFNNRIIID